MIYVMQASPLTRLRIPEWQHQCLEKPELLKSPETFRVQIPRASGDIILMHRKLTPPSDLIKRGERMVDEDEVSPLINWLTDEHSFETDMYGVVAIKVNDSVADAIMTMIIEGDTKRVQEVMDDSKAQMAKDFESARKLADDRVMRACGKMYQVVKATVEDMKKNNKGVYSPSYSEALMMEVMSETIKERRRPDLRAQEMMDKAMSKLEQPL